MKHKKINTSYDQFGGHSSGQKQVYTERSARPATSLKRLLERYERDKPIYEKIAKELDTIFADPIIKKQWQQDIQNCLESKSAYEKKKAAGKKVKPEEDPLPLIYSAMDPAKHNAAFKTILGVWHRKYRKGFNAVVTKEILSIWPEIAQKLLIVFPDEWFLEQILDRVKAEDNESLQGQAVIPPTVDPSAKDFDDNVPYSPVQISQKYDISLGSLRKQLERLRKKDHDCFIENDNRAGNEPRYLYKMSDSVKKVIEKMKERHKTTGSHPDKTSNSRPG